MVILTPQADLASKKSVLNLSKHMLTDSEADVLWKGLNFAAISAVFNLDMASAAESVRSKLPLAMGMEFCLRI